MFSVLGLDGADPCTIEVCSVKAWESQSTSGGEVVGQSGSIAAAKEEEEEELPLDECATYFSCSGFVNGTQVFETVVCAALDAHGTW